MSLRSPPAATFDTTVMPSSTSDLPPVFGTPSRPTAPSYARSIPPPSPFSTLVSGSSRPAWTLEPSSERQAPSPVRKTLADVSYEQLLRNRLEESREQLNVSDLTQDVRWYLEAEVQRLEDKLSETGGGYKGVKEPEEYTKPFCDFLTENPTVFHTVDHFAKKLTAVGFKKVSFSISSLL